MSWVSVIFTLFLLFILVIFVFYRLCTRKMRQLCGCTLADYRPTSTDPTGNFIFTYIEFATITCCVNQKSHFSMFTYKSRNWANEKNNISHLKENVSRVRSTKAITRYASLSGKRCKCWETHPEPDSGQEISVEKKNLREIFVIFSKTSLNFLQKGFRLSLLI